MNHTDHVTLLRPGITAPGGVWADLGAGGGAFTLALADLIGQDGVIYAVDKDRRVLRELGEAMRDRFAAITLHPLVADFTRSLVLPSLDGIVMANSLHFERNQEAVLRQVSTYLKPGGQLLMVEYNTERGNYWVPYPHTFDGWAALMYRSGFTATRLLAHRPSRFMGEIFSAASVKGET